MSTENLAPMERKEHVTGAETVPITMTAVKTDTLTDTPNITVNPSTNIPIFPTQQNWVPPMTSLDFSQSNLNWLNTVPSSSVYPFPISSTLPLFTATTSNISTSLDPRVTYLNPPPSQQQTYMPTQPPVQTQSIQTPPNYTLVDSRIMTELLSQNRELIAQNQQMLQTLSQLVQQLALQKKPTKMIPLGKYKLEDGETFPQFLTRFEEYVKSMYPQSSTDEWRTYLGLHLEGHIKTVYDLLMKNNSGYTIIVYELTQWFNKYISKQNKTDQTNFENAVMNYNETIPLFALRLQGLAEKAFPTAEIETLMILREKLINSLPLHIQQTVKSHVMICEMSRREEVSWDDLVNIIDQIYTNYQTQELPQRSFPIQTPINPTNKTTPELIDLTNFQPQVTPPQHQLQLQPQINAVPNKTNINQCPVIAQPPTPPNYFPNPTTFAQVAGQQVKAKNVPYKQNSNNYRTNNNRSRSRTPPRNSSNTPNRNNNNRFQQQWNGSPKNNNRNDYSNVTCNYCKKPGHDVRDCRSRPYCKFCGKRGHIYNNCYQRQNKCIHCEQTGHIVNNCPTRQQKQQSRDDSLSCTECGGPHLGKDCPQYKPPSYSHQGN